MIIQYDMDLTEKLRILGDAAKFDVSCSSSGVDRKNNGKGIGNSKHAAYVTVLLLMDVVSLF